MMTHVSIFDQWQAVKNQYPIATILSEYGIHLRRNKINCIFHEEKTPSMHIYTDTNRFHCFSCGKSGDVLDLVAQLSNISTTQAFKALTGTSTLDTPIKPRTGQYKQSERVSKPNGRQYSDLYRYYLELSDTDKAVEYLNTRGISETVTRAAGIRYCGETRLVLDRLQERYPIDELRGSGLVAYSERKDSLYLRFWKHPLVIPYYDTDGHTILTLQGRNIDGRAHCKYMFLPVETPIYNLPVLSQLQKGDQLYICEGVPDTLTLLTIGLPAIGIAGAAGYKTAYTDMLKPYRVCVVPDRDAAGLKMYTRVKEDIPDAALFDLTQLQADCHADGNHSDVNGILTHATTTPTKNRQYSEILGETYVIKRDGIQTESGIRYTADEIHEIKDLTPADLATLHKVKALFAGEIVTGGIDTNKLYNE